MNLQRSEQAQSHVLRAQAALDAGQTDAAERHVQQALHLSPDLPGARLLEARLHLWRHRARAALASLDALDRYRGDGPAANPNPDVAFLRAKALVDAGLDDLATDLLHQLADEYADDVRPHRMLVGLLLKRGDRAAAVDHLRRVVELAPSDRASRILLAESLGPEHPQDAVDVLRQATKAGTDEDRLRLARQFRRAGREAEAEDLYQTLLRDNPTDAGLWIEAGELADAAGADVAAVKRLQRALTLVGGERARALEALARVHMHAGRFVPAGRCWFGAARLSGGKPEPLAGLVICAHIAGHQRLARRMVRTLAVGTSAVERRQVLARQWLHAAGGRELAQLRATGSAAPTPVSSPLANLLAAAVQTLKQSSLDHPARADTQYHLAVCHEALGDAPAAGEAALAALALNPRYKAAESLHLRLAA
jgi:tetratricopeptide (TPR) repeat protein